MMDSIRNKHVLIYDDKCSSCTVFAKYAFKYTVDPKNYFKVNNVFSFDASKEELSKFTSGQ